MKIFPMDIIAGLFIVIGIIQIILGIYIRKYSSRTRVVFLTAMGSILVVLSSLFAYFSLNDIETGMLVSGIGWILWLVTEIVVIFLWRWRSR